jgi:uncharacterized protein
LKLRAFIGGRARKALARHSSSSKQAHSKINRWLAIRSSESCASGRSYRPYAPPSFTQRLKGREAIAAHLKALAERLEFNSVADVVKHETADPEVVIIEYSGFGRGLPKGEPYEQRYISVIRVRDGQIIRYQDYCNPIAVLRTLRGREFVKSLAAGWAQRRSRVMSASRCLIS